MRQSAAKREEQAFATIFRRYHQQIYRFCLSMLGDREDARDALQNTMVKALQALPGERRHIELKPWLYRVAHNESINLLRKRREATGADLEAIPSPESLTDTAARRERLRQLLRDLAELPERQRSALVMRELGGLSFEQIGAAFDTSSAVARQAVYEARLGLRELDEGREMSCEEVMHRLSDGDGRVSRRRDLRAHLRACADCRAFRDAIGTRRRDLAALAPLPAVASAGILQAVIGGAPGAAGGAAGTATVVAGAGKAVSAGLVAKSAATVVVVAAVGASAADRSGLVQTPLPGGSGSGAPVRQLEPVGDATPWAGSPTGPPARDNGRDGGRTSSARTKTGKGNAGDPAEGRAAPAREGAGAHRRGPPGAMPAASQRGWEVAAAHRGGGSAHAGGHSKLKAGSTPSHASPSAPPQASPKPPHAAGGRSGGPAAQPAPAPEQSSESPAKGAESSGKPEGSP
ncbi:MAG TPA: RNA polymerase sigma factor [Solirubrobacterales bacterium]